MLWHVERRCDALVLKLQSGIVKRTLYDLQHIDGAVLIVSLRPVVVHLVELGECTHVLQQLVHALALCITALQEVLLLVFGHLRMVKDALQETVDAGGGGLQFMGGILGELALDAYLVLFRMAELPVEHDDGVTDVAQLVVGQAAL